LVAYFVYRRYYRSLKHHKCDMPYPSPAESANSRILHKGRDVEQQIDEDFSLDDLSEDEAQAYPLTEMRPGSTSQQHNNNQPP
jgi:hypothetical protein